MRKLVDFMKDVAEDERIPLKNRIVLGGLILYVLTPIDLIPDFIPILGWLDDAFVTLIILDYIFNSADTEIILQHYPWNKKSFRNMKTYVERLSWLVPNRLKTVLFSHVKKLALEKGSTADIPAKKETPR